MNGNHNAKEQKQKKHTHPAPYPGPRVIPCPTCQGTGVTDDGDGCWACGGTGKVEIKYGK